MVILGVHDGHNATAALLKDGRIIACASEERFTRIKNDIGYPREAIDYVIEAAKISAGGLDAVAVATKVCGNPLQHKIKSDVFFTISDYISEMHDYWKPRLYENRETDFWVRIAAEPRFNHKGSSYRYDFLANMPQSLWGEAFVNERIRAISEHLAIPKDRIHFIDHHMAHASYAYHASHDPLMRRAAVVTADSWGDGCNATISVVENGRLREIYRTQMCNLARMYRWMTLLLGMKPLEHEYKVMGLAPYAKEYQSDPVYKIFSETLVVDKLDFKWKNKPDDMYFYFRDKFEGLRFDGIAAGLQRWLEKMLSEWITNIFAYTDAEVLYYSGGLSMNVKANNVLAKLPEMKAFYVPPSGGDESLAMGAAYKLAIDKGSRIYCLENAYLGYSPTELDIADAIKICVENGYHVVRDADDDFIADLLVKGMVIARCCGKMEFGARALGNRSILCDPSKYENIRLINEKIKGRDFWMPFTPSILDERARDYLINPKGLQAKYMTIAFESTALARKELRAAIHPYDYTVRPQLVTKKQNPEYYSLIKAFERKTGIGAVLNTSLNLHGQPIACTAMDAAVVLLNSGLDGLILLGAFILKNGDR